ncbi:hypothetical protein RJ55_00499 [Drechmeria coniospora]|nr:hypothetical protein RJ55_00499 [Drechmeria coniospora]
MAAPESKSIKDLNGKWTLNKDLSDSADPGLQIQGLGYFLRKGIGMASITITIKQYEGPPKAPSTADGNFTHIDLESNASGLSSTSEFRCLDGVCREHTDWIFGKVKGQSGWVSVDELDDDFLKKGWLPEAQGKNLIKTQAISQDNGWTATQVWGFQEVKGERRYCRNIVIQKGDQRAEFRFVYNHCPE